MSEFNDTVVTQKGLALLQKTQYSSTQLSFTKIEVGDGSYTGTEIMEDADCLKNKRQEFPVSSFSIINDETVKVTAIMTNKELKEAYYTREIGLYAVDPDGGPDILYAITTAKSEDRADYFPVYNGHYPITITIELYIAVFDSGNVTVEDTAGAYAPAKDLEKLEEVVREKVNIIVTNEDIPAAQRKEKTFYLRITDRQTIGTADNIKVSPSMAVRLVQGGYIHGIKKSTGTAIKQNDRGGGTRG